MHAPGRLKDDEEWSPAAQQGAYLGTCAAQQRRGTQRDGFSDNLTQSSSLSFQNAGADAPATHPTAFEYTRGGYGTTPSSSGWSFSSPGPHLQNVPYSPALRDREAGYLHYGPATVVDASTPQGQYWDTPTAPSQYFPPKGFAMSSGRQATA